MYSVAKPESKGFCFLLSIEQSGRVHRGGLIVILAAHLPFVYPERPNNYQSVLVHLFGHKISLRSGPSKV